MEDNKMFKLSIAGSEAIINFQHVTSIVLKELTDIQKSYFKLTDKQEGWQIKVNFIDGGALSSKVYVDFETAKAALNTIYNTLAIPRI